MGKAKARLFRAGGSVRLVRRSSFAAGVLAVVFAVCPVAEASFTTGSTEPGGSAVPEAVALQASDYCGNQCHDVLTPGEDGFASFNALLLAGSLGIPVTGGHVDDQFDQYQDLVFEQSMTNDKLGRYFNSSAFGVAPGDVERVENPRSEVSITRDRQRGIPHIRAATRAGAMFGAGYAAAEDRLFVMDVLRHAGRGELTSFAGGSTANQQLEQAQWAIAPYTEGDLQVQLDRLPALYGPDGSRVRRDIGDYTSGINAYIAEIRRDTRRIPGQYTALANNFVPALNPPAIVDFRDSDVVAIAAVVGGAFGRGGGGEVPSALALEALEQRYGGLGPAVWEAFRSAEDPEAPTTIHDGHSFPYGGSPVVAPGRVLPDPGTVRAEPVVRQGPGQQQPGPAPSVAAAPPEGASASEPNGAGVAPEVAGSASGMSRMQVSQEIAKLVEGLTPERFNGMSNALVISGAHSASGHPLAVFGPQTGYFDPQLLMEEEIQAPGISVRGASFPGNSFIVQLGRGPDYAWSGTSAGQDIADTFAVDLCEPNGSAPTLASDHYRFRGQCLPIEHLTRVNSWHPTLADRTPAGSYVLRTDRTKLGLVAFRGAVAGRPVIFTRLRSTYLHEADSAIGFKRFNDPDRIHSARDFQEAASRVSFTINWFYVDARHTAYFNSGNNPVRADGADPNLPTKASFEWRGFNPDLNTADYTPFDEHPNSVDQDFYTSWNNKQAPGFRAADDNFAYSATYRSKLLDDRINQVIRAGGKFTRASLVQAMADAATVDLRADVDLPLALRVVESAPIIDPAIRDAVAKLHAWQARGSHRRRPDNVLLPHRSVGNPLFDGVFPYTDSDAIRVMDAWWDKWVTAELKPGLGDGAFALLTAILGLDDHPRNHHGSAFEKGWYGHVSKDLRAVLGDPVRGRFPVRFCGDGNLASCRAVLTGTLKAAIDEPAAVTYPAVGGCSAGDQICADSIVHTSLGPILPRMQWMNRPTYQQVVEFPASRATS